MSHYEFDYDKIIEDIDELYDDEDTLTNDSVEDCNDKQVSWENYYYNLVDEIE